MVVLVAAGVVTMEFSRHHSEVEVIVAEDLLVAVHTPFGVVSVALVQTILRSGSAADVQAIVSSSSSMKQESNCAYLCWLLQLLL